jgi:hypothetical protein
MQSPATPPAHPGAVAWQHLEPAELRRRSLTNLLHMGHCAPTVMKTVLEASGEEADWLVRLVAGLPGGIGNSRNECGAITAPLVVLGLRHAHDPASAGLPVAVARGMALVRDFRGCHGTTSCRHILGNARIPLRCAAVVRTAPERLVRIGAGGATRELPGEPRRAAVRLLAHLAARRFHCAHEVLRAARAPGPVEPALLDATSAFVGGTACAGLTCSALTAGVMLLGLAFGEVEDSPRRVLRMLGLMAVRGDALADGVNAFNRAMNEGHELVTRFTAAAGSSQCRELTGCDFSATADVRRYAESGGVSGCQERAHLVAAQVRSQCRAAGVPC